MKFHFETQQGIENFTGAEAAEVIGNDRESSQRDLLRQYRNWQLPEMEIVDPSHDGTTST